MKKKLFIIIALIVSIVSVNTFAVPSIKSKSINTINQSLNGKKHSVSNVKYRKKTVVKYTETGKEKVRGVFPEFKSEYDAKLSKSDYQSSDRVQFSKSNEQLKKSVEKNSKLRQKFTGEQIEQINHGMTPDGYTWHHSETAGKMQLVDTKTHSVTSHTGGRSLWGGGSQYR